MANASSMRRVLSALVIGTVTGALALGAAWAAGGLMPVDPVPPPQEAANRGHNHSHSVRQDVEQAATVGSGERLPGGLFYVGGAKVSIAPVPVSEGGPWIRHGKEGNCSGQATLYTPLSNPSCLRTFDGEWATGVDEAHGLGVYVRALTISNGETTVAFAVMDTVGWFFGYPQQICGDCGARAIGLSLQDSLGIPADNIVISSTHTHASADTVAASPKWYFELVRDATKQAITAAYENRQLATIETGATPAKAFNIDRRIVTRAVPDYELGWMRAVAVPTSSSDPTPSPPGPTPSPSEGKRDKSKEKRPDHPRHGSPSPEPTATPTGSSAPQIIATFVNFSVHPTITAGNKDLHSGLVGHLAQRIEQEWGGTTLFMPAGLGDQTVNRGFGRDGFGSGLAELVIESVKTNAYALSTNEIVSQRKIIQVPAENGSLLAANAAGVFVRDTTVPGPHAAGPAHSHQQKGDARTPSCVGAGPLSALSPVGGIRIGAPGAQFDRNDPTTVADRGDAVVIMQTPGEIFSSISLVTKDYLSRTRNVMVIGLANDQIGYIIPAEQFDMRSANAAGLAQPSIRTFNYEESLSTGRCTGDQVQNALLEIGDLLNVMGAGEKR